MNLFIFHNFKLFCCNCWESFTAHWLDLVAGVQLAQAGTVSRPRMAPIEWNKMSSLRMNYSDVRYPHLSRCEETAELSGEIWCLGWAPHQPCGQLSGQLVSAKNKFCYSGTFLNIISWLCQKPFLNLIYYLSSVIDNCVVGSANRQHEGIAGCDCDSCKSNWKV